MTTTEPAATMHRHAQSAEQFCADPFKSLLILVLIGAVAVALATGLGQVILTTVGYFIAIAIALAMTRWQEPSA